jgi:hypothetical protein
MRDDERPATPLTPGPHCATRLRALWQSGSLYFIGNAMQTMAAAWMMVELTGSSFLSALVQTAVFLPMFLLSLPAGVLADIADRRRLILGALALQAVTGTVQPRCCSPASAGRPAAVLRVRGRRLHRDAVAGVELHRRRFGAARRTAQCHHRGVHRLQRRARGGPGAGRCAVRAGGQRLELCRRGAGLADHAAGHPALATTAASAVARRPSGFGAACWLACASRAIRRRCWRNWCVPWPTAAPGQHCGRCCR